jgi:rhamnose transport system ATP-binding protein
VSGPVSAAPSGGTGTAAAVPPRVQLTGISKRFGATAALSDVSLSVAPGEVHALVGENGAGKSTLVKILAGVHAPDAGTIALDGRSTTIHDPSASRAMGIAVVHQEPRLFPDLSVAENVYLTDPPIGRLRSISWGEMRRAAAAVFEQLDVHIDVDATVRGLSMADQQLIEIGKALTIDARVLILDEPTASLSTHEVERLFAIVRRTRDRGVGVLFVSHRLEEVFELSDTATVLRDGHHVITAPTSTLSTADLVRHMVGREVTLFPKAEAALGEVLLDVEGLSRTGEFRDITFRVRAGEIVGLAGLVGAGRTEVARVLFGIDRPTAGTFTVMGRKADFATPSDAVRAGIAYVPEDRHTDGLVLDFSIADNISLPILPRLFPRLFTNASRERALATDYAAKLDVRMTGVGQLAQALSGGNQQKVVIAKWLASEPRVLILDEPTRGVDIGAKVEVHRIISDLAASGLAIVLISSDLPEVLAMSDRILVLHEGRLVAEIPGAEATEERVMFAATGQGEGADEGVATTAAAGDEQVRTTMPSAGAGHGG